MRYGAVLRLAGEASRPETLARCAQLAEAAGLDELWVADHVAIAPTDGDWSDNRYLDPLATLAFLASATKRIELGTGVLVLPFRPAVPKAKALHHGDFCLENVVSGERGLCCIDNVNVGPQLLEADLARTFYRWPMTTRQRERFLLGYRRHADPTTFLDHERFWTIGAVLQSAGFRLRRGTDRIDVPLRALVQHVS